MFGFGLLRWLLIAPGIAARVRWLFAGTAAAMRLVWSRVKRTKKRQAILPRWRKTLQTLWCPALPA